MLWWTFYLRSNQLWDQNWLFIFSQVVEFFYKKDKTCGKVQQSSSNNPGSKRASNFTSLKKSSKPHLMKFWSSGTSTNWNNSCWNQFATNSSSVMSPVTGMHTPTFVLPALKPSKQSSLNTMQTIQPTLQIPTSQTSSWLWFQPPNDCSPMHRTKNMTPHQPTAA